MDYDLFETYVILCETGSITRTAELLYKTQPAISSRIQQLEQELGYTLVHREKGKKNISLTPRGEKFLEQAHKFLALYDEMGTAREQMANELTISSIGSLSATLVPDICNRMISTYGTRMSLLIYQTIEAYQMVAGKQLDLAFVSTASDVAGVSCEAIFMLDYVIVQACDEPKAPIKTGLERFDPHREIYQQWNAAFETWHTERFGSRNYLIHVDSCNVMKQFMNQPESWAVIQRNNLPEITREFPVQIYEMLDPPPPRICYMISSTHPDRLTTQAIRNFKETARAYSRENGYLPTTPDNISRMALDTGTKS